MPLRRAQQALDHLVAVNYCATHPSYIRLILLLGLHYLFVQLYIKGVVLLI